MMATMLFDVSASDGTTYVAMAVGLATVALIASFVPALRATLVHPAEALRSD